MSFIKRLCTKCGRRYEGKVCVYCQQKYKKQYETKNKDKISMLSTSRWKKLRKRIIDLDGGICMRCWLKYHVINSDNLEAHHIKSRENYPELAWEEDNIITVCKICNLQLGTKDKLDFEWSPEMREENDYTIY